MRHLVLIFILFFSLSCHKINTKDSGVFVTHKFGSVEYSSEQHDFFNPDILSLPLGFALTTGRNSFVDLKIGRGKLRLKQNSQVKVSKKIGITKHNTIPVLLLRKGLLLAQFIATGGDLPQIVECPGISIQGYNAIFTFEVKKDGSILLKVFEGKVRVQKKLLNPTHTEISDYSFASIRNRALRNLARGYMVRKSQQLKYRLRKYHAEKLTLKQMTDLARNTKIKNPRQDNYDLEINYNFNLRRFMNLKSPRAMSDKLAKLEIVSFRARLNKELNDLFYLPNITKLYKKYKKN